ncbi:MAG TPA: helix-turn-helix domain-containing protein [Acidimicrobiales bacterium]|nr:helix-turn-helix domain-containing protein [Acidimicrobiales bacterium]
MNLPRKNPSSGRCSGRSSGRPVSEHQDMVEPRNRDLTTGASPSTQPVPHSRLTLRVEEAAVLLGISRGLAYELINRGELPALRLGRRIVVPRAALEAFVAGAGDAVPGAEPSTNGNAKEAATDESRSSKRRRSPTRILNEVAGQLPLNGFHSRED